jgi:predicted transcriptional regulator
MFARYAALAGMTIGVIVIGIINSKLLNQIVTSLCENKTTNPYKIARLLGKSVARIERIMNTLVKKGRISRKVNSH